MADKQQWNGKTFGNQWMHKSLISALKVLDVRLVYTFASAFIVPVCLFFPGARIIYSYLRTQCNESKLRALWHTYINHCLFAQVVIDRFAMYAGKKFDVQIQGYEHFLALSKSPEGFIQMSAHVGNYELAGYSLVAEDKPMNALIFGGEKATVIASRSKMFSTSRITMIPVQEDMSHLFAINSALSNGEIVSFPADRLFGSPKSIELRFMNGKAKFPIGPFQTAVMREMNVLSVNVMKTATRQYTIYVNPIPYNRSLPKRNQIEHLAKGYVAELERCIQMYPTQWYNYYKFWS